MVPLDVRLTAEAVELLKQGVAPEAVHQRLVALGADPEEALAHVARLVALQREAQARDPSRLRLEVRAMLDRRVPLEDVVSYLGSLGIAEEHARPEVTRLLAVARREWALPRCQRCGVRMESADSFFDIRGAQVCRRCHGADLRGAADGRAIESVLEQVGVPMAAFSGVVEAGLQALPSRPWCPSCNAYTWLVGPSGQLPYVCGYCSRPL